LVLGESFTYRIEDFAGAFVATLIVSWLLTGKVDLSIEIGEMRKWLKWLGEPSHIVLRISPSLCCHLIVSWLLTGKVDLSIEIGGLSAITET